MLLPLLYLHVRYANYLDVLCLLGSVTRVFPSATEYYIGKKIGTYLAQAGDLEGGRIERKRNSSAVEIVDQC